MTRRMGLGDVPRAEPARPVVTPSDEPGEAGIVIPAYQPMMSEDQYNHVRTGLEKLREPFPPEMIEKLPKPMWKGAWNDKRGANCPVCHGYHVVEHCIHLDYVGHANVTNRLLEVDPFWSWEPMSYTQEGLPLFSKEGLWIRLTVCGVTRLGFGDGASIKEVIGDAIRNAAMRFGVGLDLWAKIDLHQERNPGDGKTSTRRDRPESDQRLRTESNQAASSARQSERAAAPDEASQEVAPNQDALDSLGSVCDDEGIPRQAVRELFAKWLARIDAPAPHPDILVAPAQLILDFAAHLIEVSASAPTVDEGADRGAEEAAPGDQLPAGSEPGGDGGVGGVGPDEPLDPEDTSDVEPGPSDLF